MADNLGLLNDDTTSVGTLALDEVTYSGDTAYVGITRLVGVTGAEGSKTVVELVGQNAASASLSVVPASDWNLPDTAAGDLAAMVVDLAALEVLATTIDADTGTLVTSNAAIQTAVELIDNAVSGAGFNITQFGGAAVPIGAGLEATAVRVTLPTDGTGVVGLAAGTAAIGKLAANSGVDIGDVTINGPLGGGVEAGAVLVTIASDSTGVLSVDDGGGSITIDGTVTANLSAVDNAVLDTINTAVVATQAAVEGTLTVGSHDVTNAGTFAVQINDTSFAVADGSALGEGILIQGDDGTDRKNIHVDATTGDVQVDVTNTVTVDLGANNDVTVTSGTITAVTDITNPITANPASGTIDTVTTVTTCNLAAETTKVIGTVNVAAAQTIAVTNAGTFTCQVDGGATGSLTDHSGSHFDPGNGYVAGICYGMVFDGTGWDRMRGDKTDGLKVNLGSNNDVTITSGTITTVSSVTGMTTLTGSAIAHDGADSGNPHKIGAKATASQLGLTPVAAADRSNLFCGTDGALLVRDGSLEDIISERTTNTDGAATAMTGAFAATASQRIYLSDITICNSSATFCTVDIRDGAAGAVLWTFPVPATGGVTHKFTRPLRFTANTALAFDASAATTTITISVAGFKSKA